MSRFDDVYVNIQKVGKQTSLLWIVYRRNKLGQASVELMHHEIIQISNITK